MPEPSEMRVSELAPAAVGHLGQLHLALDRRARAGQRACRSARRACDPRSAAAGRTAGPRRARTPRRASRSASAAPTPRSVVTGRAPGAGTAAAAAGFSRGAGRTRSRPAHRAAAAPRRSPRAPGTACGQYCAMTSLTLAKCDRSVRKTVNFTALASEPPAASATALRFSNTRRDLRLDVAGDQLHGRRVERHLAGHIDGVARRARAWE